MRDRESAEGGLLPPVQSPLEVCDSAPGPDFFALESPDDNAGVDADGACKVFNVSCRSCAESLAFRIAPRLMSSLATG